MSIEKESKKIQDLEQKIKELQNKKSQTLQKIKEKEGKEFIKQVSDLDWTLSQIKNFVDSYKNDSDFKSIVDKKINIDKKESPTLLESKDKEKEYNF